MHESAVWTPLKAQPQALACGCAPPLRFLGDRTAVAFNG